MSASDSNIFFVKAVLTVVVLLGFVVQTNNAAEEKKNAKKVCEVLKGTTFHERCLASEVAEQKGFIPKHLRPPWLNIPTLFKNNAFDNDPTRKGGKCFTCYKGKDASNGMIEDEEYCACQYENNSPNDAFGSLFGKLELTAKENCMDEFYKIALMSKCGNDNYDHLRHCAIVHFFKNNPSAEPDGADAKRTLVLFDGCLANVNKDNGCNKAQVKIQFKEPGTGFFTGNCYEEIHTALETDDLEKSNIANQQASPSDDDNSTQIDETFTFTFPVQLQHRMCSGIGSAGADNAFDGITISVDVCGQSQSFSIRSLDASKGRVQEMRGLQLFMNNGSVAQWYPEGGESNFNYRQVPTLKWRPLSMDSINKYGKSTMDPY